MYSNKQRRKFKARRVACPCGDSSRGFAEEIGREGQGVGYCHSCGRDYWAEDNRPKIYDLVSQPQPRKEPTKYVDRCIVQASCNPVHGEGNLFLKWLRGLVGDQVADELAYRYCLGYSKAGLDWITFWYVDAKGNPRTAKRVRYDSGGRRIRSEGLNTIFEFKKADGYELCFFGEHLLKSAPDKPVCIVEAEKTAIVAAAYFPQAIWLASGGSKGITFHKVPALQGRTVVVVPDADQSGREGAEKAVENLRRYKIPCKILDLLPECTDGQDLADVLQSAGQKPAPPTESPPAAATLPDRACQLVAVYGGRIPSRATSPDGLSGAEMLLLHQEGRIEPAPMPRTEFTLDAILAEKPIPQPHPAEDRPATEPETPNPGKTETVDSRLQLLSVEPIQPSQPAQDPGADWTEELNTLESFFQNTELPVDPIKTNPYTTVTNVRSAIETDLRYCRCHNGIRAFEPALGRLRELKEKFTKLDT